MISYSNISIDLMKLKIHKYLNVKTKYRQALVENLCCVNALFMFVRRKIPYIKDNI